MKKRKMESLLFQKFSTKHNLDNVVHSSRILFQFLQNWRYKVVDMRALTLRTVPLLSSTIILPLYPLTKVDKIDQQTLTLLNNYFPILHFMMDLLLSLEK